MNDAVITPLAGSDRSDLAHRSDLADLVQRYAAGVDDRAFAEVVELFTPGAVLRAPRPPEHLAPVSEHVGGEAISAALAEVASLEATVHALTGMVFTLGEQSAGEALTATGRINCFAHHLIRRRGEPLDVTWAMTYRDRYLRTPAGWRFTEREATITFITTATPTAFHSR